MPDVIAFFSSDSLSSPKSPFSNAININILT